MDALPHPHVLFGRSRQCSVKRPVMNPELDKLFEAEQVKLLLTIADVGSFTIAAERLGVSQPSISQQVRRLERLAGHSLFRRIGKGVRLTASGEAVLIYARVMASLSNDLRRQLEGSQDAVRVSIGMSEDFLRTALTSVLGLLLRDYPKMELTVLSGHYGILRSAVESKDVDFAVMRRYKAFSEATLLWSDELVWNGRLGYSLPVGEPVPLVLPIAPNPARDVPIETLRDAGRHWRVRFESVGIAGIEAALQAGMGICAGPRSMPLHGAGPLHEGHGLPPLPKVEFMMVGPEAGASGAQLALAEIVRKIAPHLQTAKAGHKVVTGPSL